MWECTSENGMHAGYWQKYLVTQNEQERIKYKMRQGKEIDEKNPI